MSGLKELLSWMAILGIPTIGSMTVWCIRACLKFSRELKIIMQAEQAHIRKSLLDDYHKFRQQGYLSEDDLEEWENRYQAYHELGANGVLDERRRYLMKLPSEPKVGEY